MVTPYDVPANDLIQKVAKYLKENVYEVGPPAWASIVKTGSHVQKKPENPNWWYIRCASILRKIYVHGPLGLEKLRTEYGGRKDFGVKPEHKVKAGGSIIRKGLQQLEKAGLVETEKFKGRKITRDGRNLLNEISEDLAKRLKGIVQ